jgi:hypothetical protein
VHFPPADDPVGVPSRDLSLDAIHAAVRDDDEIVTRKIRLPEATWPFEPVASAVATKPEEPAGESGGRALADLYFEQGHFAEARSLYEELLVASPADEELRRLRDEASQKAAAEPLPLPAGDPSRERRLARVRVLNEWISAVRANSVPAADKLPE